jgi:hypothetical protein
MKKPRPNFGIKPAFRDQSHNGRPASAVEYVSAHQPSAKTWITPPGSTSPTFGNIPQLDDPYDPERCCPAGEIRLLVGDIASGFVHLNAPKRKGRFGQLGPVHFVHSVTRNYDEIWVQQGRGGLLLLRRDGNKAVILSRTLVENAYVVVTAFPLERGHNFKRRREVRVWPRGGW